MSLLTFLADNGYVPERDDDDDDDVAYCSEPLTRETVTVERHVACTTFWASEPDGTLYHRRIVLSEDIDADLDQFIRDHNERFGLTRETS